MVMYGPAEVNGSFMDTDRRVFRGAAGTSETISKWISSHAEEVRIF